MRKLAMMSPLGSSFSWAAEEMRPVNATLFAGLFILKDCPRFDGLASDNPLECGQREQTPFLWISAQRGDPFGRVRGIVAVNRGSAVEPFDRFFTPASIKQ